MKDQHITFKLINLGTDHSTLKLRKCDRTYDERADTWLHTLFWSEARCHSKYPQSSQFQHLGNYTQTNKHQSK